VTGKLSDERFVKLSRDYETEQSGLRTMCETLRQDVKQGEQKNGNIKNFIAATKKYTDLKALDATVLREFVDRIYISTMDRKAKTREIRIVYNFLGAFDFHRAMEQAETKQENQTTKKTGVA
jgi:hypothetical protein